MDSVGVVVIGRVEPSRAIAVFTVLIVLTADAVGRPARAPVIAAPFAIWAGPQFVIIVYHGASGDCWF